MAAEAEGVDQAGDGAGEADDGYLVRQHALDPGPGMDHAGVLQDGEDVERGLRREGQAFDVERDVAGIEVADALVAAADHHVAGLGLLEGHRTAGEADDRRDEGRQGGGVDHHEGVEAERDLLADRARQAGAPGAGGVHQHGRGVGAAVGAAEVPLAVAAVQAFDAGAFADGGAGGLGGALEGQGGAVGAGEAVAAGDQAAGRMQGDGGEDAAELGGGRSPPRGPSRRRAWRRRGPRARPSRRGSRPP